MKLFNNKMLLVLLLLISSFGYIASCRHDNEVLLPSPVTSTQNVTRGTSVHLPGSMIVGDSSQWKLDKVHSSVLWQGAYIGAAGLLTGRFNQFGMHDVLDAETQNYIMSGQPLKDTAWAFYENEPGKTYLNGYVQINTSNTGEPGRDAGCNVGALGTVAIVTGTQNLTLTNIARIKTTKVEFDASSADYVVTLNLTWQGKLAAPLTQSIVGRLKYIRKASVGAGTAAPYSVFGLQLKFQFNCRDFGVTSTSISDNIEIECNMNFNNK
ncbi:MAG: YceI family protein [Ginsengibacter sp.]